MHRQTRIQQAQLAELVDALVSNTNIFGCAGSTPALGTKASLNKLAFFMLDYFLQRSKYSRTRCFQNKKAVFIINKDSFQNYINKILVQFKFIAHSLYSRHIVFTYFLAQLSYMNIDRTIRHHDRIFPNCFQDLLSCKNLIWFRS